MDISVTHLNNRLALQLPAQLPLGLVFVQGRAANLLHEAEPKIVRGTSFPVALDLIEGSYSIRCCLSERIIEETTIQNGDKIRAGGHLMFDPARAHYELLARDVEIVVDDEPEAVEPALEARFGRPALTPVLASIKKRSEAARLAQGELPIWVQRLAPPEVQAEMGVEARDVKEHPGLEEAVLADDLVQYLSAAMEKPEDVEITPDLLDEAALEATAVSDPVLPAVYDAPAASSEKHSRSTRPSKPIDWALVLLVLSVIFLAAALLLVFLTQTG